MQDLIRAAVTESIRVKEVFLEEQGDTLESVARLCSDSLNQGHKLLFFGNGGSAADAQHLAAEFVNRFRLERRPAASIANDHSFEAIFAKQVEALGQVGDVAIAISTSGNSPNILRAIEACGDVGCFVVGMTGGEGGKMRDQVDHLINVSATQDTARIQETHILAGHILCELVERNLVPGKA